MRGCCPHYGVNSNKLVFGLGGGHPQPLRVMRSMIVNEERDQHIAVEQRTHQ